MNRFFIFNLILYGYLIFQTCGYCSNANMIQAKSLMQEEKYEAAFKLFMSEAVEGNPEAQYFIAAMYGAGYGVKQDFDKSFTWLKKSANSGYAESLYMLSLMYWKGIGTKKNNDLAFKTFKAAAIKGHKAAQKYVMALYCAGFITKIDDIETINWLKKDANDSFAQLVLGLFYSRLRDDINKKQGFMYIKKSARQNNSMAHYCLAQAYCDKNKSIEALKLLILSAQHGSSDAQIALGVLCISIDKNSLAEKWFRLAINAVKIPVSLGEFRDYGKKLRQNSNFNKKLELILNYVEENLVSQYVTNMLEKMNLKKIVQNNHVNIKSQLFKDTIEAFKLNAKELSIKEVLDKYPL